MKCTYVSIHTNPNPQLPLPMQKYPPIYQRPPSYLYQITLPPPTPTPEPKNGQSKNFSQEEEAGKLLTRELFFLENERKWEKTGKNSRKKIGRGEGEGLCEICFFFASLSYIKHSKKYSTKSPKKGRK